LSADCSAAASETAFASVAKFISANDVSGTSGFSNGLCYFSNDTFGIVLPIFMVTVEYLPTGFFTKVLRLIVLTNPVWNYDGVLTPCADV
jgi:hypothetical protein